MDMRIIFNSHAWFKNISNKLSALPRPNPSTASNLKTIKGGVMILMGIMLCFYAYQTSLQVGAEEFDLKSWPPSLVWKKMLEEWGLKQYSISENPEILEGHPNPYSQAKEIWIREDLNVIYIASSPFQENHYELWSRSELKQKHKLNWIRLGSGASAFNTLVQRMTLAQVKTTKKTVIIRNLVDPKEIRY